METQYLKTLSAVVETGSFSRAAEALCITQSAVSQRIRQLEERCGFPLLERSGAAISLTEAGRIVLNKGEQILLLEKELETELQGLGKKKRLALCCTPTFGIVYLPQVLNRSFLANSDAADFKVVLNTPELALKGVLENEFDLAVIEHCHPLELKNAATAHPLPADELLFISAPALGLPADASLEEIMQQRLIARREGCSSRCLLQENLARAGKGLDGFRGMIIYDDLYLTIQTVLAGRGVAYVSRSLVSDYLARQELREHPVAGFATTRSRTMVVHDRRRDDRFVAGFVECVFSVFGTPAA